MEILIVGTEEQAGECRQKFGAAHEIKLAPQANGAADILKSVDVIFDFDTPQNRSSIAAYGNAKISAIFFDTSLVRLADLHVGDLKFPTFGFCGLHTFVNREILEVAIQDEGDRASLESICSKLGTSFEIVADQAGMVTPRVICMIINEAYFTLEEGTATREDIDLAMKLGTNYPYGPFEWGERIGLGNVVRVLTATGTQTGDSRYEVCPLLMKTVRTEQ